MRLLPSDRISNLIERKWILSEMKKGKIFIYPTDTIYGIGCNALNDRSVQAIRRIKKRDSHKPFSVIAPSKAWIRTHAKGRFSPYLKNLPGPYTLLLSKKNKSFLSVVSGSPILGVRMIRHSFQSLVTRARIPFVTTSVNQSGKPATKRIADIPLSIRRKVDYVIDGGTLNRPPSTLIDLSGEKPEIKKRN